MIMLGKTKRGFCLLLVALMLLTSVPTTAFAVEDDIYIEPASTNTVLATLSAGRIYEFRNTSDRELRLEFTGDEDAFVDFMTYSRLGGHDTSGRGASPVRPRVGAGVNRLRAGGMMVMEHRVGGTITVLGDASHIQVRRLQTPVFYTQVISEGVTLMFNNSSSHPQMVGWGTQGFAGDRTNLGALWGLITITPIGADGSVGTPGNTTVEVARSVVAGGGVTLRGNRGSAGWARDIFGTHTAFSGQPYRLTIDGQRSFPPGAAETPPQQPPQQPTERVPAQYRHIYDLLQRADFDRLFPSYNAFTTVYIDNVRWTEAFALGLTSSFRSIIVDGILNSVSVGGIADAIMNDPVRVDSILRSLIIEITGTNVYVADREMGQMLSFFADTLGALNSEAGYFFVALKEFDGHLGAASRRLQDYYQNIRMLESIRRTSTSPQLNQTIDRVIAAYQRDLAEAFGGLWRQFAINKSIDIAVGLIISKPFVAITSALDFAINQIRSVSGLETVIVSDNLNLQVMNAFRNAATRITDGYFTSEHMEDFRNAFYLARGLQVMRYEAMRTRFTGTRWAAERNYIDARLADLRRMNHTSFIFAPRFGQPTPPETQFADVPGHWGVDAMLFVNDMGIMQGTSSNTFAPNANFTRAQVVATLYRTANAEMAVAAELVPARQIFNDVPTGRWYAHYVAWAYENNIVTGVGGDRFAPNDNVTREQFATMMHRFAGFMDYDTTVRQSSQWNNFTDRGQVSTWATNGLTWANYHGLITGRTSTTTVPQGTATRAEAATILTRFVMDFAAFENPSERPTQPPIQPPTPSPSPSPTPPSTPGVTFPTMVAAWSDTVRPDGASVFSIDFAASSSHYKSSARLTVWDSNGNEVRPHVGGSRYSTRYGMFGWGVSWFYPDVGFGRFPLVEGRTYTWQGRVYINGIRFESPIQSFTFSFHGRPQS